jgi:plasmid stability protein
MVDAGHQHSDELEEAPESSESPLAVALLGVLFSEALTAEELSSTLNVPLDAVSTAIASLTDYVERFDGGRLRLTTEGRWAIEYAQSEVDRRAAPPAAEDPPRADDREFEAAAAAILDDLRAIVDGAFGTGTYADLSPFAWRRALLEAPESREADVDYLAPRLAPRFRLRKAEDKTKLKERAAANKRSVPEEKVDLLRIGLLWAAAEMRCPQKVKLGAGSHLPANRKDVWSVDHHGNLIAPRRPSGRGSSVLTVPVMYDDDESPHPQISDGRYIRRPFLTTTEVTIARGKWIKGEGGQVKIPPDQLPLRVQFAWYVAGAKNAAVAALRNDKWPGRASDDLQAMVPLEEILFGQWDPATAEGDEAELEDLLAVTDLTPAEIDAIEAFRAGDGTWASAAETLGIPENTLKARRNRAYGKLKEAAEKMRM